jgi:hypothetical protein
METGQKTFQTNSNLDKLRNNTLSIQVSLSGLSFCILNTETNAITYCNAINFDKILNPTEVLNELKHHIHTIDVLQQDFDSVHLIHENELSTLVPKPLFNEDFLADYLKFNSKILSNDYITHDDLAQGDIVNVYVPYVNINNFIYDTYGAFEFNHYSTILLNTLFAIHKNNSEAIMYINIANKHFEVTVLEGNKIVLYNTFEYQSKEDFIYYILFTAEQLQLNPDKFSLILIGSITENDDLYDMTYTYIRHVSIHESDCSYTLETPNEKAFNTNFILQNSF